MPKELTDPTGWSKDIPEIPEADRDYGLVPDPKHDPPLAGPNILLISFQIQVILAVVYIPFCVFQAAWPNFRGSEFGFRNPQQL